VQDAGSEAVGEVATTSDTTFTAVLEDVDVPTVKVGTRKAAAVVGGGAGAGAGAGAGGGPDVSEDKLGSVWINRVSNNLYWRLTLAPQETCSVPFEYSVEVRLWRCVVFVVLCRRVMC
jgi:hypothetical protein